MSVNTETASAQGQTTVLEKEGVYASLFEKINLTPASSLGDINAFLDDAALSDAPAGERLTAAMQVFMDCIRKSGQPVEKLDKTLIDHHIAELDFQISRQLDAVMHHQEFQKVESLWRGLKQLVDSTDYRQNVKTEILDVSKEDLRQDFEDAPELIQSGLYWHTYTAEYDTPGGEPIGSVISSYEFDASPQDVALLRNISKVSAAAHMPFIGSVGPKFFLKDSMEEVAAIKDIGNYFDRAEYIKWKSFRDTDDARYIGLVMPRVLGRLPYGPDTVPVRSFNYVEQVKGPDHEKYLWTSASFSFASNMVKSFINNGWCVQIRGPQAGGAVKDLPIHLYDLGTGNQVKIPSEVMIPETREFEFANLGFIPLSYYKNRDYACFFSANSAQKTTPDEQLVSQSRQVLLQQIGRRNAESTLYENMLKSVRRNFADVSLEDMTGGTDARRLFTTDEVVPGMFTRQAWEGGIQQAIEKAANSRRDEIDWVLSDSRKAVSSDLSPEALKARLTERYFTDFAGSWLSFLNSLQLNPANNIADVTDQLTLMSDVRQSPLIALMNTLAWQGQTGQKSEDLSDSIIKSAKDLVGGKDKPVIDQSASGPQGPLDETFGPLLALMGKNKGSNVMSADNSLSLQPGALFVGWMKVRESS
ncbi:type VI secretion system contractile sheath large subunit [Enterobacter hormaechei subsp. oharae]|uniref:type VI secretion system contractile sheath large subunit n=6 Tax=Enterobacter hormaechei TaxID=158836 RepID=UPI003A5CF741